MAGDDVGVTLHHHDAALAGLLGPMQPEQHAPLVEERRLGRVVVLRRLELAVAVAAGCAGHDAPAEADGAAALVLDREHQAMREQLAAIAQQAGGFEHVLRQLLLLRELQQRPGRGMDAESPRHDRRRQAAAVEVVAREPPGVGRQQFALEEAGDLGEHAERIRPLVGLALAALEHALQRHAGAVGELLHRLAERQAVALHQPREHVAGLAAAVAAEELLLAIDRERRRVLGVERTQRDEQPAARAQRQVALDQGDQVGRFLDAQLGVLESIHRGGHEQGEGNGAARPSCCTAPAPRNHLTPRQNREIRRRRVARGEPGGGAARAVFGTGIARGDRSKGRWKRRPERHRWCAGERRVRRPGQSMLHAPHAPVWRGAVLARPCPDACHGPGTLRMWNPGM